MGLRTGTQLGPYEVLAAIGAGGRGEVYQTHDGKLARWRRGYQGPAGSIRARTRNARPLSAIALLLMRLGLSLLFGWYFPSAKVRAAFGPRHREPRGEPGLPGGCAHHAY